MKSVLPNPRISMAPITFEVDEEKNQRKPPVAPRRSPRGSLSDSSADEPATSSIKMKVSKFEYLAAQNFKKSISPKVFSSNLVTVRRVFLLYLCQSIKVKVDLDFVFSALRVLGEYSGERCVGKSSS